MHVLKHRQKHTHTHTHTLPDESDKMMRVMAFPLDVWEGLFLLCLFVS